MLYYCLPMSDFAYAYFNSELDKLDIPSLEGIYEKDSVVLAPQIGIVDKSCLVEKVSKLSPAIMLKISAALADLLAI